MSLAGSISARRLERHTRRSTLSGHGEAPRATAPDVVKGVVALGKSLESVFHADDWTDDQAADLADRLEQLAAAARECIRG